MIGWTRNTLKKSYETLATMERVGCAAPETEEMNEVYLAMAWKLRF